MRLARVWSLHQLCKPLHWGSLLTVSASGLDLPKPPGEETSARTRSLDSTTPRAPDPAVRPSPRTWSRMDIPPDDARMALGSWGKLGRAIATEHAEGAGGRLAPRLRSRECVEIGVMNTGMCHV
jgi:hypothetical protein